MYNGKFRKEFCDIAFRLCKDINANRSQLAKALQVREATISAWKKKYKQFEDAIENGRKEYWNF